MPEIDKVISHLKIIYTWAKVDGERGRGIDPACCRAIVGWVDDAFALLKAQQPRVMTLEELDDLRGRGQAVYYQDRDSTAKSQDAFFMVIDHRVAWFKGETYTFCKTADGYGKVWRCWTSRPTDEQREAEPWNS